MGAWDAPLDSLSRNASRIVPAKAATARNYQVLLNAIGDHTPVHHDYMNTLMEMVADSNKHVTVVPKKIYKTIVPDVKGMGLKDAVYILESNGLQVTVKGKGKVQGQSLAPGTTITKGQNIILQLS